MRFQLKWRSPSAGSFSALEHTGIEPFRGHVQMDAEADRLFKPIVDGLKNALGRRVSALRVTIPPVIRSVRSSPFFIGQPECPVSGASSNARTTRRGRILTPSGHQRWTRRSACLPTRSGSVRISDLFPLACRGAC
jgi:hypothetical protein